MLKTRIRRQWLVVAVVACLLALAAVDVTLTFASPQAQGGSGGSSGGGFQEYYIPGTQEQMFDTFNHILVNTDSSTCVERGGKSCSEPWEVADSDYIEVRVSVVAYADSSSVYVDHAIDGYDFDINDPDTADEIFNLDKGQTLVFDQFSSEGRPAGYSGANEYAVVGGDRIYTAGGPVFVIRAGWPTDIRNSSSNGQVLAGYWELYPVGAWGNSYASPMGGLAVDDDDTTHAFVSAAQDGTEVHRDGSLVTTLNQGETFVIQDVLAGQEITGSQPIQVGLATSGHHTFEMRFMSLTPPNLVGNDYWLPVTSMYRADGGGRGVDLRLYAYAYDDTTLIFEDESGVQATRNMDAGDTARYTINNPTNSSRGEIYHVYTDEPDDRVQLLVAVDSGNSYWDWGYPAVDSEYYADEYYLAWSPATGPDYPNDENSWGYLSPGEPVFITPLQDGTEVRADWDGDGNDDYFIATLATEAGATPVLTNTIVVSRFQSLEIIDPDLDNTGGHIYGNAPFAMVWGEAIEADGTDGYDLGYSLLPAPMSFFAPPVVELSKSVSPDEVPAGGILDVHLTLQAFEYGIGHLVFTDTLPSDQFSYVAESAIIYYPDGSQSQVEPGIAGQVWTWSLDDSFILPAGQVLIVEFQVQVSELYAPVPDSQVNQAQAFADWTPPACLTCAPYVFHLTDFDFMRVSNPPQARVSKTLLSADPVWIGGMTQDVDFEIVIQNTGILTLTTLALEDVYDASYLGFVSAEPAPDDAADDGQLNWTNLLAPDKEFVPGERLTVTVRFAALQSTTSLPRGATPNWAIISGTSIDGQPLPPHQDWDEAHLKRDECPDGPSCDGDSDGDDLPGYLDPQDDGDDDGIPDDAECPGGLPCDSDSDGDGIPDYLDPDDDGDGIPTADECSGGLPCADSDDDGIPDYLDPDDDGDGVPTADECAGGPPCADSDDDGIPDYLDPDDDGDGVPTADECADGPPCVDSDDDGTPDYLDPDDDGDGIPTATECAGGPPCADSDGDGTPDYLDPDSDGDGIPDSEEAGDDPLDPVDSDGDGMPDYVDPDSDDDGISDADEWSEGPNDPLAGCTADDPLCFDNDADGDGIPNYLDLDSDDDGIPDSIEGTTDSDGDGIPDWIDPNEPLQEDDYYYLFLVVIKNGS